MVAAAAAAAAAVVVGGGGGGEISYNISMEHCVERFIVAQRSNKFPHLRNPKFPLQLSRLHILSGFL